MYNDYFQFSCSPFENTLDQRFLFLSEGHEEVIAALLYFTREKKSFAMVSGDVGTGKTMLIHHFLGKLPASVLPILIPYPGIEYEELLRYIARALGVVTEGKGVLELSDDVKAELSRASAEGKQTVLVIDEAHLLPVASLENIRLLSNIELTENKLLQILLIGQNELSVKLSKPELRQLRQRINISRVLSPMGQQGTIGYIDYRLKIAGSSFEACFEPGCRKIIHAITGGVPRNINRLCDTALLICMIDRGQRVTRKVVKKAQSAQESDPIVAWEVYRSAPLSRAGKFWPAYAAAVVFVLAASLFGYTRYRGRDLKAPVEVRAAPKKEAAAKKRRFRAYQGEARNNPGAQAAVDKPQGLLRDLGERPVPVATPVAAAAPVPVEGQTPVGRKKEATANKRAFPQVGETGPVPAEAKQRAAGQKNEVTNRQSIKPSEKKELRPIKTGAWETAKDGHEAEKPAPANSGFIMVTVRKGDSLSRIAAKWFPEDPKAGLKSIVAANPQIHDEDLILVDSSLKIPIEAPK